MLERSAKKKRKKPLREGAPVISYKLMYLRKLMYLFMREGAPVPFRARVSTVKKRKKRKNPKELIRREFLAKTKKKKKQKK